MTRGMSKSSRAVVGAALWEGKMVAHCNWGADITHFWVCPTKSTVFSYLPCLEKLTSRFQSNLLTPLGSSCCRFYQYEAFKPGIPVKWSQKPLTRWLRFGSWHRQESFICLRVVTTCGFPTPSYLADTVRKCWVTGVEPGYPFACSVSLLSNPPTPGINLSWCVQQEVLHFRAVVFNLFCLSNPRCNVSSTLYPQSCWCIIQGIHSL
jgi:hypothetical protein